MKRLMKVLALVTGLFLSLPATANDGFSVGGVGSFGGEATNNPVTENGWPDLNTFRQFRDCCSYENTPADATLANNALAADNGTPGQAEGSNCQAASYATLKLSCGLTANSCQSKQRSEMDSLNTFNNANPCLSPGYLSYSAYQTANGKGYIMSQADATLYGEATTASPALNALCPGNNCATTQKSVFENAKLALAAGYTTYAAWTAATNNGYDLTVADYTLYTQAQTDTYDAFCAGSDCSNVSKTDFQAAKLVQANVDSGNPLTGNTIQSVVTNTSSTVDSDLTLSDPLHLSFVQNCIGSNTAVSNITACTSSVDGAALNQHVVSEIAGGASGTITSSLLQDAGVSADTANIAAGNTCGPNEDQSCLAQINSVLSADATFTGAEIEAALASYFETLLEPADTVVADATTSAGCASSSTTFAVPSPPAICASVNWNCTSNTNGISVTYDDNGKGNIVADTLLFSGGAYTVTATTKLGGATRTITGNVNINQLSAAAGAGYKTGSQPAWWRNYNVIERARNACANQGGSLTTYAELQAANATYNIIGNGTRTIFADASGNASASTSGRQQCSESWPQGPHSLRWYTWARSQTCKGRAGFGRNFTYVCKDIPCN